MAIVQSGFGFNGSGVTTAIATFGATATIGNTLVILAADDGAVSTVVANGGAGGAFIQRKAGAAGLNCYLYDKVAVGTETGATYTSAGITGHAFAWYELSGVNNLDTPVVNLPGVTADPGAGSLTPTVSSTVLFIVGHDSVRSFVSCSVGTWDGVQPSSGTTNNVCITAGHLVTASLLAPTFHDNSGSVGNSVGIIAAYNFVSGGPPFIAPAPHIVGQSVQRPMGF